MTDCPEPPPPPPPDAPILRCLDPRRVGRFVAVLDVVLAHAEGEAEVDNESPLRADEHAWVRASAPLLCSSEVATAARAADPSAGAGCLKRYYAAQAPAIAARLCLLLPYDNVPPTCRAWPRDGVVDVDVVAEGRRHGCLPGDVRAERRFLDRTWRWGERQCFW